MKPYDHKKIEKKWQKEWDKKKIYKAIDNSSKEKFYTLFEFPFPSGEGLHVGHMRPYIGMDIISRKRRMEGKNVLFPIGWDAFGLPTENYAIKTGKSPVVVTKENTDNFRRQIKAVGPSLDWDREINTSDPKYYKWTQWIFLEMQKRGLAYKKKMVINWCPKDKIGLANEEVIDGKCERCGTPVEKREKEQWMLAITKYADRLDKDLDTVDFQERIKIQQRNWIGKSEGAEIEFELNFKKNPKDNENRGPNGEKAAIKVFTTRADTLFGVTYIVLSPEHLWVTLATDKDHDVLENKEEVKAYVQKIKNKTELERTAEGKEKTGVELKGVKAMNPATGEEIPMFVADYVLANYGTAAVMAVPAHDERDFEFAKKYKLPIKNVIEPIFYQTTEPGKIVEGMPVDERESIIAIVQHWSEEKFMALKWKKVAWGTFITGGIEAGQTPEEAAKMEIREETGYLNATLVKDFGKIHGKFYHVPKKTNRFAHSHTLLMKLENDARDPVTEAEQANHELLWLTKDELKKFLTPDSHQRALEILNGKEVYTGHGMLTNSGEFDGMYIEEAGKVIGAKFGKIVTTYKLRDWVFSRQRYWGEPIPMVHCEACATTKQKVLIIHGFEGHDHNNWFPWMKAELEKQGFDVRVPKISTADHPTLDSWMKELTPLVKDFGPHDIIIGHSLGSKAALHLLEKTKKKIGALYLVASAIGTLETRDWDDFRKRWKGSDIDALKNFWLAKIDLEKASRYARKVVAIRSEDDPNIQPKTHVDIPKSWDYRIWNGFGHFNAKQIPELLNAILESKITGWIPVPEKDLPVKLPDVKNYQPTDTGESPLASITKWVNTKCPVCGGKATRETDTMPNWAGSSWYYLRYIDPKNSKAFADEKKLDYWTPVDWYNGGMEHTTLHLLYSRFWHKFLFDIGAVPTSEPYKKRTSHGLILAEGGVKMSKSIGNVVNPDSIIESFGADTLRLYEMFMGPFDQAVAWSTDGIVGPRRFLERVWKLQEKVVPKAPFDQNLESQIHQTIDKVSTDIELMQFNTAVSSLMILSNAFEKKETIAKAYYEHFLKLLAPFAPHITEEIWQNLGNTQSIHLDPWDKANMSKIKTGEITIVVQINGKVRAEFATSSDISEKDAVELAQKIPEILKWTEGKEIKRVIFVKGKLINIVVV